MNFDITIDLSYSFLHPPSPPSLNPSTSTTPQQPNPQKQMLHQVIDVYSPKSLSPSRYQNCVAALYRYLPMHAILFFRVYIDCLDTVLYVFVALYVFAFYATPAHCFATLRSHADWSVLRTTPSKSWLLICSY
jgi:hypothetical protein